MTIDDAVKWLEKFERSYRNTSRISTRLEGETVVTSHIEHADRYKAVIGWLKELQAKRGEWSLAQMQEEQRPWVKHNFNPQSCDVCGRSDDHYPFLGLVEELGELAHAVLKAAQKIRGSEEKHREEAEDAVGDLVIYLADFCSRHDIDLQDSVRKTWEKVKQRDWKKNPENGAA
jgi:NTP pyrophosphatase (non-canonical NTP hydrolase)